jgi:hypothetical protein
MKRDIVLVFYCHGNATDLTISKWRNRRILTEWSEKELKRFWPVADIRVTII